MMSPKRNPGAGGAGARRENILDPAIVPSCHARVNRGDAVRAIEVAVATEPSLTAVGVSYRRRGRHEVDPCSAHTPLSADDVATAIKFLVQCRPTMSTRLSSYGLKHAAERWGRRHGMASYVSNGALIAAAISLGLSVARDDPRSPNVAVAVRREDVARLDPEFPWLRRRAA